MSERPSSFCPRSCSGDMNSSVPSVWPTAVSAGTWRSSDITLAMPKSSTLTWSSPPRDSMNTFSGFMSRWTMPLACASLSDAAT